MIKSKISIIIPNYNHALFLKERLESVFGQTYQNFEVILLDDASTDNSLEILKEYKNHPKISHYIINKENSGSPFKQWKKGLKFAKGDYIWIAESDDYCELNFLEKVISVLKNDSDIGLTYCQSIDVNEEGNELLNRVKDTNWFQPNIWNSNFNIIGDKFVSNYLSVKNVIPNASAVVFKKELVTNSLFTDSLLNMKMCGDWFFWIQLSLQTKIGFIAEELNYFRSHQSISRSHSNVIIKKRRLLEESSIRSFLQDKNIINLIAEYKLYIKWFKLHSIISIFSLSFYKIKLSKTATFTFITHFLRFKLK